MTYSSSKTSSSKPYGSMVLWFRIKPTDGDWLPSIFSGESRRIAFLGLPAGANYTIELRTLGGLTGQSDWSDPGSHVAR
jgi:hypothetical protein